MAKSPHHVKNNFQINRNHVLCHFSHVLCQVLCPMSYVLCPASCVLCPMSCVLRPASYVLCPTSCLSILRIQIYFHILRITRNFNQKNILNRIRMFESINLISIYILNIILFQFRYHFGEKR